MSHLELLLDVRALLGEGPCWHRGTQRLYWVDIFEKRLHIYDRNAQTNRTIQLEQMVGCVAPRKSGGLILALQNGFATLNLDTETVTRLVDPESHLPDNRFNDGKCDPAGRFLAGTMHVAEDRPSGSLYSLDTTLQVKRLFDQVTVSNGISWSFDYQTMYYIDSPTRQVVAFDYDLETGDLSRRRVVVTIPEGEGFPDGMTTDVEGMIWVAQWGGFRVSRWNPATGARLQYIEVPAPHVSSCTFGGPEMNELYITTARKGLDRTRLDQYPLSGGLFRFKTAVEGMQNFEFGG